MAKPFPTTPEGALTVSPKAKSDYENVSTNRDDTITTSVPVSYPKTNSAAKGS